MSDFSRRRLLQGGTALAALAPSLAACARTETASESADTAAPPAADPPASSEQAGYSPAPIPDATRQAEMIASGEITSLALTEAAIARARASQPILNAIANDSYDAALTEAASPPDGTFGGVPTFIKDLLDWKDAPTLYGSRAFEGYIAAEDAPFARSWRDTGVISLGKSTTPEMGLISSTEPLVTGPTRNPWDTSRIPGGSSGGAAALVAARVVPMAHASDGGGSIRIPAACCGLFGLKPSRGAMASRTNEDGPVSISVNHAVTLSVRDSATMFAATELQDGELAPVGHITGPATRRLKIGFAPASATGAAVDTPTQEGVARTAQLCRELGHEVIDYTVPLNGPEFIDRFLLYWSAGAAGFAQQASAFSGKPVGPDIVEPWTLGLTRNFLSRQDEMDATIAYLLAFEAEYASWFDSFDVLLTPTVSSVAPKIGTQAPDGDFDTVRENVLNFAAFTAPMNVAGAASMNVPLQWSDEGLPVGSMFSGKRGDDGLLFALAYELEQAQPWIDRLPQL